MLVWDEETGDYIESNEYTEFYLIQSRVYEYETTMHLNKLYMSITEACIATRQRIDRENFKERNR